MPICTQPGQKIWKVWSTTTLPRSEASVRGCGVLSQPEVCSSGAMLALMLVLVSAIFCYLKIVGQIMHYKGTGIEVPPAAGPPTSVRGLPQGRSAFPLHVFPEAFVCKSGDFPAFSDQTCQRYARVAECYPISISR